MRERRTQAPGLCRRDMLSVLAGAGLAALAGCNDGAPIVTFQSGSAAKPTAFGSQVYASDDPVRAVGLLAATGAKYVRAGALFPLAFLDALVGAATQHALRVVLITADVPQPVDLSTYARAAAKLHFRYAAANPIWEVWNEPNLAAFWGGTPDVGAYIGVLTATASALRAAGATDIWTGGTSGVDLSWIYNLVTLGAFRSATGCAVHSYKPPGDARTEYTQAVSFLPAGVGLHTTETCIASSVGDQSQFFNQMWYLHRELNLPTMLWCELRDGTAGASGANNEPYGLVSSDYTPKDVYTAAQLAIRTDD